jgi:hypothetical protein
MEISQWNLFAQLIYTNKILRIGKATSLTCFLPWRNVVSVLPHYRISDKYEHIPKKAAEEADRMVANTWTVMSRARTGHTWDPEGYIDRARNFPYCVSWKG